MSDHPMIRSYGRQVIDDDDVAAVTRALTSDFLTTGPEVKGFEDAFASTSGAAHAVACGNGTAGLHMACLAAGLGPGQTAIVPAVTFVATANAVRMTGASVRLADVDPETGLMTQATLDAALAEAGTAGERVTAVLPVHLGGQPAPVGVPAGLTWIDDACHAVGTAAIAGGPRPLAAGGDAARMAVYSCHPVKTITTGEGGMVVAGDDDLAARLRRARDHGLVRDADGFTTEHADDGEGGANPWHYEMVSLGWNYRLCDLQAALGRSQLAKLPGFLTRRQALIDAYDEGLARLAPHVRAVRREDAGGGPVGWHLSVALIDFAALGTTRARVMRALRAAGVGTQVHYIPIHHHPYYAEVAGRAATAGAEAYFARCLSLPLHPGMDEGDVATVIDRLAEVLGLQVG